LDAADLIALYEDQAGDARPLAQACLEHAFVLALANAA
jgi:hypothetical protein